MCPITVLLVPYLENCNIFNLKIFELHFIKANTELEANGLIFVQNLNPGPV